jgi:hypothetical protein
LLVVVLLLLLLLLLLLVVVAGVEFLGDHECFCTEEVGSMAG